MSGPTIKLLTNPNDEQLEAVASLFVRAFDHDLPVKSMTGGNPAFEAPLFRAVARAGIADGAVYVVESEDTHPGSTNAEIRSVLVCFGPGKTMSADEESARASGWVSLFEKMPVETKEWWAMFRTKHSNVVNAYLRDKYTDGWYVELLGTDPTHQNKGHATALLAHIFAQADEEGKTVALTTHSPSNVKFYEKLGFEVVDSVEIEAPTGDWVQHLLVREQAASR
ncbi:hypothetical protein PLEOSDRAFT_1105167 [Pleurotus ostreatus PC15]|uniref:N-acetyltransferase domain-containing protein n=1 Tax=Pleurotus ostreatus (strain PC15) TaxID=1137138 RepID=A0A067NND4_PLEO1|nr:hypothetical protein PLEOSDRAFT_1105167 [Pleurotus ostreatus PC15]